MFEEMLASLNHCVLLVLVATFLLTINAKTPRKTNPNHSTSLRIVNYANSPIEIFWMQNDNSQDLHRQLETPLRNSTDVVLWSFDSHKFLVRFANESHHGGFAVFEKGKVDETFHVIFNSTSQRLEVNLEDKYINWKNALQIAKHNCKGFHGEALADCVGKSLHHEVNGLTTSIEALAGSMSKVSYRLRNYTCDDDSIPTSAPISTHQYRWHDNQYSVQTLLNMTHAQIWLVEDFVTPAECAELERVGRPKLHRATVAAEDGTSIVSENRKAQQAAYDYHQHRLERDPLWDLQQRILDITNLHTGFNLTYEGQEGFTIIQYNPDDQYTPHCDGTCDHSMHSRYGRVATAVMYCKVPEEGGATTFTRANLLVRPKFGAVTFFSYRGVDGRMDSGYTEHSGCPVKKGEKIITTFWMRDGVTLNEPWTKYDPTGLPILDSSQTEND